MRQDDLPSMELTAEDFLPLEQLPAEEPPVADLPPFRRALRELCRRPMALAALVVLGAILLLTLFAPLSPYDPDAIDTSNKLQPPSAEHWFGTDELGRDSFTRALYGGRVSLLVGTAAMAVSVLVGMIIGAISGFMGGIVDALLMRFVDMLLSVPSVLLIIVLYAFIPTNMITLIFMLAFFSWTNVARIVRAQVLSLKEWDFVTAARSLGMSRRRIIFQQILPNTSSQIIVAASLSIANAILDESSLSFLGYGVQLPQASWGSMLQSAQQYILYNPILAVIPGAFILVTVLCFHILGDALQHALDPRLQQ